MFDQFFDYRIAALLVAVLVALLISAWRAYRCPNCGKWGFPTWYRNGDMEYRQCKACGHEWFIELGDD